MDTTTERLCQQYANNVDALFDALFGDNDRRECERIANNKARLLVVFHRAGHKSIVAAIGKGKNIVKSQPLNLSIADIARIIDDANIDNRVVKYIPR